MTDGHQ
jgi:ATP-binding cassette subfamily B (MDR/TAP) protein 1